MFNLCFSGVQELF